MHTKWKTFSLFRDFLLNIMFLCEVWTKPSPLHKKVTDLFCREHKTSVSVSTKHLVHVIHPWITPVTKSWFVHKFPYPLKIYILQLNTETTKNRRLEKDTSSDGATRRIEVHVNGLGRVFRLEKEELRNDNVSSVVGDGAIDANDPLLEQPREYIVSTLPSGGVLDHHGYQPIVSSATTKRRCCIGGYGGAYFTP